MVDQARTIISERGEVIVKFVISSGSDVDHFSRIMSVDHVIGDTIIAYASEIQFERFLETDVPFRILQPPSLKLKEASITEKDAGQLQEGYPSYTEYIAMMEDYAENYSDITTLVDFGRSAEGRKLLALKITDHPGFREQEPVFLYTSTMHGDEVVGYVLMLRLIDELLTKYETDSRIKTLVDHIEIWINPVSNPDGTYFLSDESVYGATRFNANHVDLNRNFPNPLSGDHPDGNEWQPETVAMMNLMKGIRFSLAANIHSGAEVVNYPWDTWSRLHADDSWYREISRAYADTAQKYSPEGYMTFLENGITNGYAWYSITGGRQDYSNYFLHAREVTIELSDEKVPDESVLPAYWEYNKRSLLDYIEQVLFGISGTVTDERTGNALRAKISIAGHDRDSSEVYSSWEDGLYHRLINSGTYTVSFQSPGYHEESHTVNVPGRSSVRLDISLSPLMQPYKLYPNPFSDRMFIYISEDDGEILLDVFDLAGHKVISTAELIPAAGNQQIHLNGLVEGLYIIQLRYKDYVIKEKIIKTR